MPQVKWFHFKWALKASWPLMGFLKVPWDCFDSFISFNVNSFSSRSRHHDAGSGHFPGLGSNSGLYRFVRKPARPDLGLHPWRQLRGRKDGPVWPPARLTGDLGDGGSRVRHRQAEEPVVGADDELGVPGGCSLHLAFWWQLHLAGFLNV